MTLYKSRDTSVRKQYEETEAPECLLTRQGCRRHINPPAAEIGIRTSCTSASAADLQSRERLTQTSFVLGQVGEQ